MLERPRRIHLVGVGGSGMSPIAELLLRAGHAVSGSDLKPSEATARLERLGLRFHQGHAADHVGDAEILVASSAIGSDNPELARARDRGVRVIKRGEMLAELMNARTGIAIAGAHGKTTTSSMTAVMLTDAGLDPTAVIGGRVGAFGSNARIGASDYFVAEADESDRSFLLLSPVIAVVTNIDEEHLESYASFEALEDAFVRFAGGVPAHGAAIICLDDPRLDRLRERLPGRLVTYAIGRDDASLTASDIELGEHGSRASVWRREANGRERLGTLDLRVPGRHNVQNALAAVAVGLELGVPFERIAAGLLAFAGTERRFERRGDAGGVTVIDDYGHHPTEIAAVLDAARASHPARVVVAFQPHRYSRTARLRDEFGRALAGADAVVLTDIYPAGEPPMAGVTLEWLAGSVRAQARGPVSVVPRLEDVPAAVARLARPGDLVITLGAGSIGTCGDRILEELRRCR